MIRYALKCPDGHSFDSWFQSSAAYETLRVAGHLACAVCGGGGVEKAVMSPSVAADPADRPLSRPASPAEQAIAELRRRVEAEADHVGPNFAEEARAIHAGLAPRRMIYGEASLEEARTLLEDDIPVAPLPWRSRSLS